MSRRGLIMAALLMLAAGCQTVPRFRQPDVSQPGSKTRQGQAVWRANAQASEIAGELYLSSNPAGDHILQFIKTPFPIAVAQTTTNAWQISFPGDQRNYSGRGQPPARIGWFVLMSALEDSRVSSPWQFSKTSEEQWRLTNSRTGELIEGYLSQ